MAYVVFYKTKEGEDVLICLGQPCFLMKTSLTQWSFLLLWGWNEFRWCQLTLEMTPFSSVCTRTLLHQKVPQPRPQQTRLSPNLFTEYWQDREAMPPSVTLKEEMDSRCPPTEDKDKDRPGTVHWVLHLHMYNKKILWDNLKKKNTPLHVFYGFCSLTWLKFQLKKVIALREKLKC